MNQQPLHPSKATHYPGRNGPICGASPAKVHELRQASAYTTDTTMLTCEECLEYMLRLERHGQVEASIRAAGDEALAAGTPKAPRAKKLSP